MLFGKETKSSHLPNLLLIASNSTSFTLPFISHLILDVHLAASLEVTAHESKFDASLRQILEEQNSSTLVEAKSYIL